MSLLGSVSVIQMLLYFIIMIILSNTEYWIGIKYIKTVSNFLISYHINL
jgi:hypothetical protein